MIQPSAHRLRPLALGDILDTGISLYRQNFALFAGVVAILAVPEAIINVIVGSTSPESPLTKTTTTNPLGSSTSTPLHWHYGYFTRLGIVALITLVFNLLISGPLSRVISERYLGHSITIGEAYSEVGVGGFVTLAVASILSVICEVAPIVIATVITILLALLTNNAGFPGALAWLIGTVVVIAGFVLFVIVWVRLQFVAQAAVIERQSVTDALSRSWNLVKGSSWRVFGIVLVVSILVSIISAIVGGVVGIPLSIIPAGGAIAGAVVGILLQPFEYASFTLLYYDLRVRKEGFDMEQLAGHIGRTNPLPS